VNGIYWIYGDASVPLASPPEGARGFSPIPLAVVLCPRGGRHLAGQLRHVQRAGVNTLVSLLSEEQVAMLELGKEGEVANSLGMQFLHHPIPDHELPRDERAFRAFVGDLANRLRIGQRIGIHCWGSIGRATVTAACTLIHLGWNPGTALAAVEAARGCPVPDTEEQENWILNYKAQP
jgi:protein-tyrosine phosphatase